MPNIRPLPNKPLVEAILELRWHLPEEGDPNYNLLPGRMHALMQDDYPFHQPLPTALIPQPAIANIVQHRFRVSEYGWPLVQVGPGVVTFNETDDYEWVDFGPRASKLIDIFFKAHPKSEDLRFTNLTLRYVNAVALGSRVDNTFDFVRDKLKTTIELPSALFDDLPIRSRPAGFTLQAEYETEVPKGTISIRLSTGTHHGKRSIVWENTVISRGEEIPNLPQNFNQWLDNAHKLTDTWFFTLIEGELDRKFSG